MKSSGWTSGGSTAYRIIGRVTGLCLVVTFCTVVWERSDGGQLSSLSCRQLVDHDQVACLCLGEIISDGQSGQLQRQRCVGTEYGLELVKYENGLEHCLFKRSLIDLLTQCSQTQVATAFHWHPF